MHPFWGNIKHIQWNESRLGSNQSSWMERSSSTWLEKDLGASMAWNSSTGMEGQRQQSKHGNIYSISAQSIIIFDSTYLGNWSASLETDLGTRAYQSRYSWWKVLRQRSWGLGIHKVIAISHSLEMFGMMFNKFIVFQSRFMEKESRLAFTLEENMETGQKANLGAKQSKYRTRYRSQ